MSRFRSGSRHPPYRSTPSRSAQGRATSGFRVTGPTATSGYYWVPGEWVFPPRVGLLWTPGYWGYSGSNYVFNEGYWGPSVGFYGGINYGYGYYGTGYYGGRWVGDTFRYNTAVTRVNTQVIHDTYVDRAFARNARGTRASFNGPSGVRTKPNAKEQAAASAEHVGPTSSQQSRVAAAASDPALHAGNNKGKPKAAAVKTFESNHGPDLAGTAAIAGSEGAATKKDAAEQAGVEKPANEAGQARVAKGAGTAKQARSGKGSERLANNNSARSRSSLKTTKNKHVASCTDASSNARPAPWVQQDGGRSPQCPSRLESTAPGAGSRAWAAGSKARTSCGERRKEEKGRQRLEQAALLVWASIEIRRRTHDSTV